MHARVHAHHAHAWPHALQAVLAHELGHLKCDHGVWLTAANVLALGTVSLLPVVSSAVEEGLLRWLRAAELTCDRAALLVAQDRCGGRGGWGRCVCVLGRHDAVGGLCGSGRGLPGRLACQARAPSRQPALHCTHNAQRPPTAAASPLLGSAARWWCRR